MPNEEAKGFKVAAVLTEEEMITLSEVLWPNGALKSDDTRNESARSVWKKLVVTTEIKNGCEFKRPAIAAPEDE